MKYSITFDQTPLRLTVTSPDEDGLTTVIIGDQSATLNSEETKALIEFLLYHEV